MESYLADESRTSARPRVMEEQNYFEVRVISAGQQGKIGVGFERKEILGCIYSGHTGTVRFYNGGDARTLQRFTTDDVVGVGINYISEEYFFTKNGAVVGTAPKVFIGDLYPTIILNTRDEEVAVNFLPHMFAFDFAAYEATERENQNIEIEKISVPSSICYGFVRDFLSHYGYQNTLRAFEAFEASMGFQQVGDPELHNIPLRKLLREHIMGSEIDAAADILKDGYPQLVQDNGEIIPFLLLSLKIIATVQAGQYEEEAMGYAKTELNQFSDLPGLGNLFQDCTDLLDCKTMEDFEALGKDYLLGQSQKELIADAVNAAVLSVNSNGPLHCLLERLLKQVKLCSELYKR